MNSRFFLSVLLGIFCVSLAGSAHADTPLEISMKKMGKAYKDLMSDLQKPDDASKADYLALSGTLKTSAQDARGFVPKKAAALPPDQQDTMVKAYQKSMDDLIATIDSLSQDIQSSQWDDARKAMATIRQQMIEGHKAFRQHEHEAVAPTSGPSPSPAPSPSPTP